MIKKEWKVRNRRGMIAENKNKDDGTEWQSDNDNGKNKKNIDSNTKDGHWLWWKQEKQGLLQRNGWV